MNERIIEIEANSMEEARRKLYTEDIIVLEEFILCHGRVETIETVADTVKEAFIKVQSKVPAGAKTETQEIKIAPKQITLQVQGDNEESAGKGKAAVIKSVSLLKKGRKGLWGIGKTTNVYEVVISQQAVVELKFREQAKLRAKVRDYLAEDLFQSIQEARQRNAQWTEILQLLNPKNDSEIHESLMKLEELNPLSVLDTIENTIEDVYRKNEKANWQMVIKKAYKQASDAQSRELEEKKVSLRRLDVKIAEAFMFYTSIDWYEKDYARKRKEPTGIPRHTIDYDHHRLNDERLRETIPYYSTNKEAFSKLEERVKGFNHYEFYLRLLIEEGQDETTATLEQKCIAALKVHKACR